MWSSVPFFLPFRACCCPSEVINGFVMYESVIASVCCLVWIAHISSSFMPSVLTVRRHDKAVLPFGFSPRYSKQVYNYVLQKHKEDRRNPFTLCRKKANGLKKVGKEKTKGSKRVQEDVRASTDIHFKAMRFGSVSGSEIRTSRTFPEGKTSIETTRISHCWNIQWIFNKFWTLWSDPLL